MADVGDRVAVTSKGTARSGVVTALTGSLLQVRWDTGEETSFTPAAGALTVIGSAPTKSRKSRPTSSAKTTGKKKR